MTSEDSYAAWARMRQQRIEQRLAAALAPEVEGGERLAQAMRHATLGGGKRMRALLAYAAGEAAGAAIDAVDPAAAAVELVHAYSLIHDDLPCMDDDAMRRGRPSCHVAYGEATALLAGDALQALAFATLARAPRDAVRSVAVLAEAAGMRGMVAGQAIDLAATGNLLGVEALAAMHRLKTGALIGAAVTLGAQAGDADMHTLAALDRYAAAAGLAFQVVDDILDVEGSPEALGKTPGKDAAQRKPTYVSVLGLEAARMHAATLRADAHAALDALGAPARRLAEIADWIALRSH